MKGSNVTVCPFVVQESYLRNTYMLSSPFLTIIVLFPFSQEFEDKVSLMKKEFEELLNAKMEEYAKVG